MHKRDREVEGGKKKRKRAFECVVSLLADRMGPPCSPPRSPQSVDLEIVIDDKMVRKLKSIKLARGECRKHGSVWIVL